MSRYTVKPLPNSDVVQSCKGPCTARATWNDGISEVARVCGGDRQCLGDSRVFGTKEGRDKREVWLLGESRRSSEGLAARRVGSEQRRACRAHGERHVVEVCSIQRAQSLQKTIKPHCLSSGVHAATRRPKYNEVAIHSEPGHLLDLPLSPCAAFSAASIPLIVPTTYSPSAFPSSRLQSSLIDLKYCVIDNGLFRPSYCSARPRPSSANALPSKRSNHYCTKLHLFSASRAPLPTFPKHFAFV